MTTFIYITVYVQNTFSFSLLFVSTQALLFTQTSFFCVVFLARSGGAQFSERNSPFSVNVSQIKTVFNTGRVKYVSMIYVTVALI